MTSKIDLEVARIIDVLYPYNKILAVLVLIECILQMIKIELTVGLISSSTRIVAK